MPGKSCWTAGAIAGENTLSVTSAQKRDGECRVCVCARMYVKGVEGEVDSSLAKADAIYLIPVLLL